MSNRVRLKSRAGSSSGAHPKSAPGTGTRTPRWIKRTRKFWVKLTGALLAVAALIGALQGTTGAVGGAYNFFRSDASKDFAKLNNLRTGELSSAFSETLGIQPLATTRSFEVAAQSLNSTALSTGPKIDDNFYILPTVYVEAFVNVSNDTVEAYTVTVRRGNTDSLPPLKLLGQSVQLGKTTVAAAPIRGIADVAEVCAAHIVAFFELSDTDESVLAQRTAVGLTSSGGFAKGNQFPACPMTSTESLDPVRTQSATDGAYTIDVYKPTDTYLAESTPDRAKMIANSVCISAPGWPVMPEMISLHPEEVARYDPSS